MIGSVMLCHFCSPCKEVPDSQTETVIALHIYSINYKVTKVVHRNHAVTVNQSDTWLYKYYYYQRCTSKHPAPFPIKNTHTHSDIHTHTHTCIHSPPTTCMHHSDSFTVKLSFLFICFLELVKQSDTWYDSAVADFPPSIIYADCNQ